LLDSTRLALSSFDIWGDILVTNREAILEALRGYIGQLQQFSAGLDQAPTRQAFETASRFASRLREAAGGHS
jgi:prephenate dehydrogenase